MSLRRRALLLCVLVSGLVAGAGEGALARCMLLGANGVGTYQCVPV